MAGASVGGRLMLPEALEKRGAEVRHGTGPV